MTRYALFLVPLLLLSSITNAEDYSGNYWLPHCKAFLNSSAAPFPNVCAGIVEGISDVLEAWGWDIEGFDRCVNIPKNVILGQKVRVVAKYMEERPQRTNEAFNVLVEDALVNAWPCKKGGK